MANKKISELTSASLPLAGTEIVPIVQGGETKKVVVSEFGGNQNLQQVTDLGNTTTNIIEVLGLTTAEVKLTEGLNYVDLKANNLTTDRELFAPDENGTIALFENTLSNDIADYTTATLPLSDTDKLLVNQGGTFKEVAVNTQSYFTFSTNTTLSNSHHNAVIWVTATCNITIPSGLRSDFNCTFRTLTGAIATFLTSGTTINAESDGDVQSAKTMSFLAQYTQEGDFRNGS